VSDTTLHTGERLDAAAESTVRDYVALLKPRVMSLVVFTGLVGLVLAPGTLHPLLAGVAILCIAVGAGAAGALNMWYDADIDARMARTRNRPIPKGRVAENDALAFGVVLSVGAVTLMGLGVNYVAAGLLAGTILFYVLVYTMGLKRRTPQNIVIGGAAGALPPVIGWAAVTGGVDIPALVLFGIIFMWTPPHFWALSLFRHEEYAAAGVPMLPVTHGAGETRKQILIYTALLAPLGVAPYILGFAGALYGAVAGVLGALFLGGAVRLVRVPSLRLAKQLFAFSILYLFLLFAVLLVERLIGGSI